MLAQCSKVTDYPEMAPTVYVTSHEILDPKKRPDDANELLLFSDTSINNETHSNEILHIRMVTGLIFFFSVFRHGYLIP